MQSKYLLWGFALVIIILGGMFVFRGNTPLAQEESVPSETSVPVESAMPVPGSNTPEMVVEQVSASPSVKEFTMTSFVVMEGNKPHPQFSVNEITVKKGDTVRIKVTNTKGMHNFNIDEFNVQKDTPLDQEVTIEFVADKAGDFVYYCSMPGHRTNGHWGTLRVTE